MQADRQIDTWKDMHAGRQADKHVIDMHADRQMDTWIDMHADRQIDTWKDRHAGRKKGRQTRG